MLTNTGPWGTGSFTVADALVKEFLQKGHEVLLFFPDTGFPSEIKDSYYNHPDIYHIWEFPIKVKGFEFPSFPLIIPDPHPRSNWNMTYKDLPEEMLQSFLEECSKKLQEVVQDFSPDIIECQHLWFMNYHISKLGIPYFSTGHHSDQIGYTYDVRAQPYILESLQKVEKIFAVSHFVEEEILDLYKISQEKVVTFYNGYDGATFFPFDVEKQEVLDELGLDISPDHTFVSFAGKISKTKGIDTLLQANLIMNRDDIHFLILGGGDPEDFIKKHFPEGINTDRVHFLGHLSPRMVARVHNICRLSTLPSRSEGFGIACLEAMACALPVVVTSAGGLKEVAVGTFVEIENPLELAEAIMEIADLPKDKYLEIQEKALERVKKYSWKEIAEKRLGFYQEALKSERKVS